MATLLNSISVVWFAENFETVQLKTYYQQLSSVYYP